MTRWLPLAFLFVFSFAAPFAADAQEIAVAAGADQFLAVWTEADQIRAQRFDLDGSPIDSQVVIAESANARIDAASDGVDYLIVWGDTAGVRARFLSSAETLTLLEGTSTQPHPAAVTWNGVDFLVAWGSTTSVHAALIHPEEGVVRSTLLDSGLARVTTVSVASGMDRDLILYTAYTDATSNGWWQSSILDAQIVDRNLGWLTTTRLDKLQNIMGCMGQRALGQPLAVWTGSEWQVTWIHSSCFLGHSDLLARLSRSGTLSPPRVRTPFKQGVIRSQLLMIGAEPALVTQFLDHGTPRDPVVLQFLTRSATPQPILPAVREYAAAMAGRNRLVLVYRSGEGVAVKVETIDLRPRMRRRAVR